MFTTTQMQLGLSVTVIVVVIAVSLWLLRRLRDYTTQDRPEPSLVLSNLEEMLRKGDISEEEFRTIKASTHAQFASTDSAKTPTARSVALNSNNSTTSISSTTTANESAKPVDGSNRDDEQSMTS